MESVSTTTRGVGSSIATARDLSLTEKYRGVRQTSLRCCAPLSVEDHSLQAMPDASPAKWHLAHTTWFFETFLLTEHLPGYKAFHPAFRSLFNSYYNAVGDRPLRALRHTLSRPALEEVHGYRNHVDEAMMQLLSRELSPEVLDLVALGLNHEQQHQELILTDVKYGLAVNPLRPAYREAGRFGEMRATALSLRANGYGTANLWLSDGWDCVRVHQWSVPLYWEMRDGQWWHYTMDGMRPVCADEPMCHVSYYEADAFAHWAGARLATEFEWEVASRSVAVTGNFLDSEALHPQAAATSEDLTQMFGDVWEWTASSYLPYPGFRSAAGAVGEYNGKFMCNQMVLRGGSCATPQSHIRHTYRNFFPPHVRWQFMGIRLANGD
jgi:hypothetical protein